MFLLGVITRHLRRTNMAESRFGREVVGDPRFVGDLRRGREPRPETIAKICSHIAREQQEARRCG